MLPSYRAKTFATETEIKFLRQILIETRGSIYKISYDLSQDYLKFIVGSTTLILRHGLYIQ